MKFCSYPQRECIRMEENMTIGAINGNYQMQPGQMGQNAADDPVAKGIQEKIAKAQKELKELSANTEMSIEQKQKKRQELQQEINDLNMQLRQHQMEQKQKERQEKMQPMDELMGNQEGMDSAGKSGAAGNDGHTGFSTVAMEALISADGAKKAAQMQGSVAARMEGRAATLEAEIKLDAARGGNTERKKEEMASLQAKAQAAQVSQMSTLSDANERLEAAAQKEAAEHTEDAGEKDVQKSGVKEEASLTEGTEQKNVAAVNEENAGNAEEDGTGDGTSNVAGYTPVDVRI